VLKTAPVDAEGYEVPAPLRAQSTRQGSERQNEGGDMYSAVPPSNPRSVALDRDDYVAPSGAMRSVQPGDNADYDEYEASVEFSGFSASA
jgi:hypothetical protein